MQLACHDLLVCKYLTLYIRVLLFIMCFNFFHHAPLGNQFVLKELACLNKVFTYLTYLCLPDWKVCKMRGGDRNLPVFLRGQMAKFARATRAWSTRAWSTRAWSIRLQGPARCDFLLVPFCSNIIY